MRHPFAGSYATVGLLCLIAVAVLARLRLTPPPPELRRQGRPLAVIASQPRFLVAVTAAAMGYTVMVLLMAATPLAMRAHHHAFSDTAFVIQWHVLAMFAPSFFTGGLIKRFGVVPILASGLALNLACVGINLSGQTLNQFWLALFLLGVGWNFLFVGGTSPTDRDLPPRGRCQGAGAQRFRRLRPGHRSHVLGRCIAEHPGLACHQPGRARPPGSVRCSLWFGSRPVLDRHPMSG